MAGTRASPWRSACVLLISIGLLLPLAVLGGGAPALAGTIQGTVTRADDGSPLPGVAVFALTRFYVGEFWYVYDYIYTDEGGAYQISGLPSDTYRVVFTDEAGQYASQYYNNKPTVQEADDVSVTEGEGTGGIDAALNTGGTFRGTVTCADTGAPLPGVRVTAYPLGDDGWWWWLVGPRTTHTDETGQYELGGLHTGDWQVFFRDDSGHYLPHHYDSVSVTAGQVTTGIDATLIPAGRIQGRVTDADGSPLEGVTVEVLWWVEDSWDSWWHVGWTWTNETGEYDLGGLEPGTFRVHFYDGSGRHLAQYYNNKFSLEDADDLSVASGEIVTGIDAVMARAGRIQGRVTDTEGVPLEGVRVSALQGDGSSWWGSGVYTNEAGEYDLGGLDTGTYRVMFGGSSSGYATRYYDNKPSVEDADDVFVTAGELTTGIDAALTPLCRIQGRVTDAGGTPLPGISVSVVRLYWDGTDWGWDYGSGTSTNEAGEYDSGGLDDGHYRVEFRDWASGQHLGQYYDNKPNFHEADILSVSDGDVLTGIDAILAQAGRIQGTVTDSSGVPLQDVRVVARQRATGWGWVAEGYTDAAGQYNLGGLGSGTYRVEFRDWSGQYLTQYFDNKAVFDDADDVSVVAGQVTTGIDAILVEAGRIQGTVTASDSSPLEGIGVAAYRLGDFEDWYWSGATYTNEAGEYVLGGLESGTYRVEFRDGWGRYFTGFYNNKASFDDADNVSVVAGEVTTGIDATLVQAGRIQGTVRDAGGSPLQDIPVYAFIWEGSSWEWANSTWTSEAGEYHLGWLHAGTYLIFFQDESGVYAPCFYDNKPSYDAADTLTLTSGQTASGIDATLEVGGRVRGTVRGPDDSSLEGVLVVAFHWDGLDDEWYWWGFAYTNEAGEYDLGGLGTGTYRLSFRDASGLHFPGFLGDVAVTVGETTTGVDVALAPAGRIEGTVRDTVGLPLEDIEVIALRWNGSHWGWVASAYTNESGEYILGLLGTGTYRVKFEDWSGGYAAEYYNNKPTLGQANDVFVTEGLATSGIDATLASPEPLLPDFVVESIGLSSSSAVIGRMLTATVTIRNEGALDGDAGWMDVWYDKADPAAPGDPSFDDSTSCGWIHAGESRMFEFRFEVPGPAGAKTFRAFVNSEYSAPESDYDNNQLTREYTARSRPAALPGVLMLLLDDE